MIYSSIDYKLSIFFQKRMKNHHYFNMVVSRARVSTHGNDQELTKITSHPNLFQQHKPEKCRNIKFEQSRTYDYVGVKELKAYYERARRPSKQSKRNTMNSYFLGFARPSAEPKLANDLLSTAELIELVSPETSINKSVKPFTSTFHSNSKQNKRCSVLFQSRLNNKSVSQISLEKIKEHHKLYEQLWNKAEQICQEKTGLPSIIHTAEERIKTQEKENIQLKCLKNSPSQDLWQAFLRDERDFRQILSKKKQTIQTRLTKHILLRGKSKLENEKEWIHLKGIEGFRFKLLKEGQTKKQ